MVQQAKMQGGAVNIVGRETQFGAAKNLVIQFGTPKYSQNVCEGCCQVTWWSCQRLTVDAGEAILQVKFQIVNKAIGGSVEDFVTQIKIIILAIGAENFVKYECSLTSFYIADDDECI